jgi:hypothetical protein
MFATSKEVKHDMEYVRNLNLAAVQRTAIQMTRQPL